MSSAALTTPSNQHAAAASQLTIASVQLEEQKLLDDSIQHVLQHDPALQISATTIDRFKNSSTYDDFLKIFDELRLANSVLKPTERGNFMDRAIRFAENVLLFRNYGNAIAQINQGVAAPIWGAICATLLIVQSVGRLVEQLDQLRLRLSKWTKRFRLLYDPKIPLTTHLREELFAFHVVSIRFSLKIASILETGTIGSTYTAIGERMQDDVRNFSRDLNAAAQDVDASVLYEMRGTMEDIKRAQVFTTTPPLIPPSSYPGQPLSTRRYNVPSNMLSRSFTGRRDILQAISSRLNAQHDPDSPSRIALHGISGIGKSQTALKFAKENSVTSTNGKYTTILYARAKDDATLLSEYCNIARDLGLLKDNVIGREYKDAVISDVKRWLEQEPNWLFIYDDVTQVNVVVNYLPYSGTGHILFTTRSDIVARSLAPYEDSLELMPMDHEREATELALRLAFDSRVYSAAEIEAARNIATFAHGLPLVIEQVVTFARQTRQDWNSVLTTAKRNADLLSQDATGAYHESELSARGMLNTVVRHLEQHHPRSADLFKILVYLEPSAIPRSILYNAKNNVDSFLRRQFPFDRGSRDNFAYTRRVEAQLQSSGETTRPSPSTTKRSSKVWIRKLIGRNTPSESSTEVSPSRFDTASDIEMTEMWQSSSNLLQLVLVSSSNIESAINDLRDVGILRTFDNRQSFLWIHDLFSQMGREFVEQQSIQRSRTTAHLVSTMVYLTFPIPELPDPYGTVDRCMQSLPHAMACQQHLKDLKILNDTTIGPELSHLIASTIAVASIRYSKSEKQHHTRAKAIEYYQDAYLGYLSSWKRLLQIKGMTRQKVGLSAFTDYAWEDLRDYEPRRHLQGYERFGTSAPWRCISTMAKLGSLLLDDGRLQEAVDMLRAAHKLSEEVFGRSHVDTLAIDTTLMNVHIVQENWKDALEVASRRAIAYMNPDLSDMEDNGKAIRLGLRDTKDGGEMARDIGFCCMEIPGMERRAIEMFENELAAKETVWGKTSAYCCGPLQRLSKASERIGDLCKSLYWQGVALDLAIEDSQKQGYESEGSETASEVGVSNVAEEITLIEVNSEITVNANPQKQIEYGKNQLRVLEDRQVAEIITRFRQLLTRVDVLDRELENHVNSWTTIAEVWETMNSW